MFLYKLLHTNLDEVKVIDVNVILTKIINIHHINFV